jgi:drug/metabolite transporter (DMT)-like permease
MRVTGDHTELRTLGLTAAALVAFAANSLLCRLALGGEQIDAASYTSLRLVSGAVTLWAILALSGRSKITKAGGGWVSAAMLFLYAIAFSFAYVSLDAGIGALILFGAVQTTMLVAGFIEGHRPRAIEWLGLLTAFGGLVYLVSPGISAPAPVGSLLMAVAGIAWGLYSLRGRGAGDPLAATAANFVRALPFAVLVSLLALADLQLSASGVWLAVASGALASGLGYVIWYAALKGLTTTRAAVVQLAVPVVAAAGGVIFLAEVVTLRLVVASIVVLGGVAAAILGRGDGLRFGAGAPSRRRMMS